MQPGQWLLDTTKIRAMLGTTLRLQLSSITPRLGRWIARLLREVAGSGYAYLGIGETSWAITADVAGGSTSYYFGVDNSIALDSNGNPRIAYFEPSFNDLEFASCDSSCDSASSWEIVTLEEDGTTGKYVEMSIDQHDVVHMGYYNSSSTTVNYLTIRDGPALTQIGEVGVTITSWGDMLIKLDDTHRLFNGTDTSDPATCRMGQVVMDSIHSRLKQPWQAPIRTCPRLRGKPHLLLDTTDTSGDWEPQILISRWIRLGIIDRRRQWRNWWLHVDSPRCE